MSTPTQQRRSRWEWLLPEVRRSYVAVAAGILPLPVYYWLVGPRADADSGTILRRAAVDAVESSFFFLAFYLIAYLVLTHAAFSLVGPERCRAWAAHQPPGTWRQRYLYASQPGLGLAVFVSALALIVAVWWLPGGGGHALPRSIAFVVGLVLVVGAWLAVVLTHAVDYLCRDQRAGGGALDFPGDTPPGWGDYVYFATGVSTTFGTTDVSVRSGELRGVVTRHALVAFAFNTVVLAAVVGLVVGG